MRSSGGGATGEAPGTAAPLSRYVLTPAEAVGVVVATAITVVLVRFAGLPIQAPRRALKIVSSAVTEGEEW